MQTIIVPGAGESHFDAFEENPFQNKKQKKENLVKKLMDKIPLSSIQLNPNQINTIDTTARSVIMKERKEEEKEKEKKFLKTKKKIKKMRGRNSAKHWYLEKQKNFNLEKEVFYYLKA